MEIYETEDQQIENLSRWWKEHGSSILSGVALGVVIILGWQGWQKHVKGQSEAASVLYDKLMTETTPADQAVSIGEQLIKDHASTGYASFAAFMLAKLKVQENNLTAAASYLQWVLDHESDAAMLDLARLRQGYVFLAEKDYAKLQNLLDHPKNPVTASFAPLFTELKGDLFLAQGDSEKARATYQEALNALPANDNAPNRNILQIKLDDLAVKVPPSQATKPENKP